MSALARKNNLARNLQKMNKKFKADYNFYPQTYMLPFDLNEFKEQYTREGK